MEMMVSEWELLFSDISGGSPPEWLLCPPIRETASDTNKVLPSDTTKVVALDTKELSDTFNVVSLDNSRATKANDAKIPVFLWDDRIWALGIHSDTKLESYKGRFKQCPLTALRSYFLRV
jgi:hypothetical protein